MVRLAEKSGWVVTDVTKSNDPIGEIFVGNSVVIRRIIPASGRFCDIKESNHHPIERIGVDMRYYYHEPNGD